MVTPIEPIAPGVARAIESASAIITVLLEERAMNGAELARLTKKRGGPSRKTVYNVLKKEHLPDFESLVHIAEALDVPPWTLLIEGLEKHRELLKPGGMRELASIVDSYLKSTPEKRAEIETVARAAALVSRTSKP
jgi:transcriptional regulator with XRE-family HTH domain